MKQYKNARKYLQEIGILNEWAPPAIDPTHPDWSLPDNTSPIDGGPTTSPRKPWKQTSPGGVPVPGTPSPHRGGHNTSETVTDDDGTVWRVIYHWVDGVLVDTTYTEVEPDEPWTYQNDPNWGMYDDPSSGGPGGAGGDG